MNEGRWCEGCAYHRETWREDRCMRPREKINRVTGRPYALGAPCWDERSAAWWPFSKRCGPEGRYWTPKPNDEADA